MRIIRDIDELSTVADPTGIALGTFDGLHIGHQEVIRTMIGECHKHNLKSCVFTFANHPRELTSNHGAPPRILSLEDKITLLESWGVDYLVLLKFDKRLMSVEATDFVEKMLLEDLRMKYLVVGYDFRFGKGAKGNVGMLQEYSDTNGFSMHKVEPVEFEGEKISSSRIRERLMEGDIDAVTRLLGRHHWVSGEVIKGKQVGAKLGFPTANLNISSNMTLIKPGVYITKTWVQGDLFYSVTNVGFNPTFDQENFNVETHILEFDKDIYGEIITVEFHKRIRDELKMNSLEQLVEFIERDVRDTEDHFGI